MIALECMDVKHMGEQFEEKSLKRKMILTVGNDPKGLGEKGWENQFKIDMFELHPNSSTKTSSKKYELLSQTYT